MTEANTYGDGGYGSGGYSTIDHLDEENLPSVEDFIDALTAIQPALDPNDAELYRAATLFHREFTRHVYTTDVLYDQRLIEYATDSELDRLGADVGVERPTGESDDTYRKRVKAGYVTAKSRGTFEDVAKVAVAILDCDPSQVEIRRARHTSDPATAQLEVEGSALDDSPFTESEIKDVLSDALVGGHRLTIQRNDVFTWGESTNGWGTQWGSPTST